MGGHSREKKTCLEVEGLEPFQIGRHCVLNCTSWWMNRVWPTETPSTASP